MFGFGMFGHISDWRISLSRLAASIGGGVGVVFCEWVSPTPYLIEESTSSAVDVIGSE